MRRSDSPAKGRRIRFDPSCDPEPDWRKFPALEGQGLATAWLKRFHDGSARKQHTFDSYAYALSRFLWYCNSVGLRPVDIREDDVLSYVRCMLGQDYEYSTAKHGLSVLRGWFDFLVEQDEVESSPIGRCPPPSRLWLYGQDQHGFRRRGGKRPIIRSKENMPRIFSDEQWQGLLREAGKGRLRDRLILGFAYAGALRKAEVIGITTADLDYSRRTIMVSAEHAKGGRARVVHYPPELDPILMAYLDERRVIAGGRPRSNRLFLSESHRNKGEPITGSAWAKSFTKLLCRAGLTREKAGADFFPHTLRHQRLTHLTDHGLDLIDVSKYAGHRSVTSTERYVHLSGRRLSERLAVAIGFQDEVLAAALSA